MARALCLLTCLLAAAVAAQDADPSPPPLRLPRGQELVYLGSVQEEEPGRSARFLRRWQLEARALALESKADSTTIAVMTILRSTAASPANERRPDAQQPASVRLELVEVDPQGRLRGEEPLSLWHTLDGPSTWEFGFFVEVPRDPAKRDLTPQPSSPIRREGQGGEVSWLIAPPGRPPARYRTAGFDPVNGVMCLKVEGEQQSADWDRPRADSTAWRVREKLWITPRTGYAQQVERVLERRDPAHREPAYRLVTRYKLDNWNSYRGPFFEDRRREIQQTKLYADRVVALLPNAADHGPTFETIIARISHFVQKHPETPYREALVHTRRLAEAGRRNEIPPQLVPARQVPHLAIGKPAPDFVVTDLRTGRNLTLRQWRGKTLLMAFYHPGSPSAAEMLGAVQRLQVGPAGKKLLAVGFVMSDDHAAATALGQQLNLTFPQVAGTNLRASYEVEATPRFVLVDRDGLVAAVSTGFGPETPAALAVEIERAMADR
jgi:hypothetical protein